jgi:sugar (glycoside-pentoside-hexuronide) transporter
LFGAIPLGLISILTFTVPDLDAGGKLAWAYTTYILFGVLYTVVTIPYATLTASITSDYEERTKLSTYRIGCAFIGGFTVSVGTMPFVSLFESEAEGFQVLMILFSIVATGLLYATFKTTAEVVQPVTTKNISLADSARAILRNPPLMVVIGIFSCGMLSFTVRQSTTIYFFIYNVGDPSLIAWFFSVILGSMLIGIWGVPTLAEKFGKAGATRLGAYLTIIGCIGFYFTPWTSVEGLFFWGCVVALGGTPVAVLGWAMIPDTVEYAEHKLGVRSDGAIYSTASFFQKLAKTIGGAGVALVLGLAGYQANQPQTAGALDAIHGVLTLVPIGIMVILIILTKIYPLDKSAHDALVRELAKPV